MVACSSTPRRRLGVFIVGGALLALLAACGGGGSSANGGSAGDHAGGRSIVGSWDIVLARELGGSGVSTAQENVDRVRADCHQGLDAILFRFNADGSFAALYVVDGLETLPAVGRYTVNGTRVTIVITQPAPTAGCTSLPLDIIATAIDGELTWVADDTIVINDGTALNTLQRYSTPRHRTITGVVVDQLSGQPLAQARVYSRVNTWATTDNNGRFRIGGLPRVGEVVLDVARSGYGYLAVHVTNPNQTDVRVELKPGAGSTSPSTPNGPSGGASPNQPAPPPDFSQFRRR